MREVRGGGLRWEIGGLSSNFPLLILSAGLAATLLGLVPHEKADTMIDPRSRERGSIMVSAFSCGTSPRRVAARPADRISSGKFELSPPISHLRPPPLTSLIVQPLADHSSMGPRLSTFGGSTVTSTTVEDVPPWQGPARKTATASSK